MKHVHWAHAHTYNYPVLIYIGSWKQFRRYMNRKWKCDMGKQKFFGGQHVAIGSKLQTFSTIWMPRWDNDPNDINTLSHELNHMCFWLFDKIGIEAREGKKNEEFCHLQGNLLEQALETLNHKRGVEK